MPIGTRSITALGIAAIAGLTTAGWVVAQPQRAGGTGGAPATPMAPAHASAAADMATAAHNFWTALTPEQQAKCTFPFEGGERVNWHFIPRTRKGITWNDLTPAQQALGHAFLASGLSSSGYRKAVTIMSLDQILKDVEKGRGPLRDPNNYAFSVFGTPGPTSTWGWRVEGHHLSLNFTIANGQAVAGPVFFGTNPAEVREGPRKGLRVLSAEDDLGHELIHALNDDQRKKAIIETTAPKEIITSNKRKADLGEPKGIPVADLTAPQKQLVLALLQDYAHRLRPELAEQDLSMIQQAGLDKVHFAWAGGLEPGQGHYYRLHGPTFLVEFDMTQDNANHIHSVWRDPANDFGDDLLKQHYDASHPNAK